jgi:beta-glucosidase
MDLYRLTRTAPLLALLLALAAARADEPKTHTAVTPVPREGEWWNERHQAMNARAEMGDVDLVFIGDSITQGWEGNGKAAWEKHFAPLKAMNLGISGDRTQHVLWRLDNGNLEGITPKVVVIMIGTNNSNGMDNTAEEIADGIQAIVARLRKKLPEMKILVLAVFPRGEKPNPQRDKIKEVNETVAKSADGKTVYFLDIGGEFLADDGSLPMEIMPDFLHLSEKGYTIWAEAIEPKVKELMGKG